MSSGEGADSEALRRELFDLKHRVEALERALATVLKRVPEVRIVLEVPRVVG